MHDHRAACKSVMTDSDQSEHALACAALHAGVGCLCMFSVRVLLLDLLQDTCFTSSATD
jgi:hypothetical protein